MKAIILAAGQGTRMKKYTKNLPKGMLNFMGKSLIEWQIAAYRSCGIDDIMIVKGFSEEKIEYKNIKYFINDKFATTNMLESFMLARSEFDTDIIVSYADIWFERRLLESLSETKGDFVVSVDMDWQNYWEKRYGSVQYDLESLRIENGEIIELGKETSLLSEIDARYIGLLKMSKSGLDVICSIIDENYRKYSDKPWKHSGKTISQAYMTDLLQEVIDEGYSVIAKKFQKGWLEFDTNEDYENVCEWINSGEIKDLVNLGRLN